MNGIVPENKCWPGTVVEVEPSIDPLAPGVQVCDVVVRMSDGLRIDIHGHRLFPLMVGDTVDIYLGPVGYEIRNKHIDWRATS